ncbi:putative virion structural protein [Erwinia phage vB_EamM_MadMel]|uniref:Putative virion structural protein n=3 Tax=Agricanvirus TaxID=1984776 RepID=A0A191ZCK5_9CAUD|nr:putative virion structural protein [Erwinia phage vB_EamM_Simmy50]YP_009606416.1 putative virion structural protein [Erwinia phage vB_EamM_Special G]ANH51770.1 putative virion structural protein [Erwinia phage vB_EamM_Simmy50]ANJ65122.1 putative virion structural protein [Erwinia phage vB_EamM_Special G]AUG86737.1 putative virion structural protein [Erwinia phage vB_EamM_MadMel]
MNLEKSSLYNEIIAIGTKGGRSVYRIKAEIFFDTTVCSVFRVRSLNRFDDFMNRYSEELNIEVAMSEGVYNQQIIPNATRLKMHLVINKYEPGQEPVSTRYTLRVFPKTGYDPQLTQQRAADINQAAIAATSLQFYQFQLFTSAIEQLSATPCAGIFPTTSPAALIRVLLGGVSEGLELPLEEKPLGMEMYPVDAVTPDGKEIIKNHVVVKPIQLCDLPGFLQHEYGLYKTAIGSYYHKQYWHIWPLYNTKRFELVRKNLIVVNVPKDKFPNMEHTYEMRGSSLCVLATGDTAVHDTSNLAQYQEGNGVRATRSSAMSGDEGMEVKQGQVVLQRGATNSEFITNTRQGAVNFAPMAGEITDNSYRIVSKTAVNNGSTIQVTWQNADPELIFPGMPVKYLYMKSTGVEQRYGTLVMAEAHYRLAQDGLADEVMLCDMALTLFIDTTDETANSSL